MIGIMGSAEDLKYSNDALIFAKTLGKLIAKSGNILVYGAEKEYSSLSTNAAIEANKYRQKAAAAIEYMLRKKPRKRQEQGIDYKFNAEGNQLSYYYFF